MSGLFGGLGSLGGSTLGEVLVRVGVDIKPLEAGLAKAEADTKASTTSVSRFGTAAKVAFAVAAVAVVKYTVDAVKAYQEHEVALTKLESTLQNNNTILDKSTAGFEAYAASLSRTTGFTETQITAAQAIAARYGLNATQTEALTQVSIDYARVTGKDLPSASLALGKALLGSGRAIKDVGQRFVDTGTLAGNYNEIITLVGQSTKGAADAFAKTGAGALAKFGAAWDRLKISFGQNASGPIVAVLDYVTEVLTYLPAVIGTVENAFIDLANVWITVSNFFARGINLFFPDLIGLNDHIQEVDTSIAGLLPPLNLAGTKFAFVGSKAQTAADSLNHFAHQTAADLKKWERGVRTSLGGAENALSELEGKTKVTAHQVEAGFRKQLRSLQDYEKNLETVKSRHIPDDLLKQIADMGTQGAGILSALAGANKQKFDQIVATWRATQAESKLISNAFDSIKTSLDAIPNEKNIYLKYIVTTTGTPPPGGPPPPAPPGGPGGPGPRPPHPPPGNPRGNGLTVNIISPTDPVDVINGRLSDWSRSRRDWTG